MLPRNLRERSALVKGIIVGAIAGAFLPDSVNPYQLVQRLIRKG